MEHAAGWRKLLCNKYFSTIVTLLCGYILTQIGYANIWPLFGSANQLLSALVERTIGLVKAYAAGSATFRVEGLQLIIAILLMALGLIIVINSLKAYFKAQKESA